MSSRALRARVSESCASATRTRARAASRVAVLRSRSALEMKPRPTSCAARSSSACARSASALATRVCAACASAVCAWTDRSTVASTWPAPTHWPGSTRTRVTRPPSPATPTGISRRAARLPVPVMTRWTVCRPGTVRSRSGSGHWPRRLVRRRTLVGRLAAVAAGRVHHQEGDRQDHHKEQARRR